MNIAVWILERDNKMKTLINKQNPAIRITAEVEILYDKFRCVKYYYIKDLRLGLLQENWTLVEEESAEGIKGNLEEIPSNVDLEKEIDKVTARHFYEWRNNMTTEQNAVPSRETILGIWELGNFWKENPEERDGLTQLQYIQKYWSETCDYQNEQKPVENPKKGWPTYPLSVVGDLLAKIPPAPIRFMQEQSEVEFEKLALEKYPVQMVSKDPFDEEDDTKEDLNEYEREAYLEGLKAGYELGKGGSK